MTDHEQTLRQHWNKSSIFQRFELAVTIVLQITIAIAAMFALLRLLLALVGLVFMPWDVTDLLSLQVIFGMVMTVLIALEFGRSLQRNMKNHAAIIDAREIVLIGVMAVVRKLIILDMNELSAPKFLGLAAVLIALAGAYWLLGRSRSGATN